MAMKPKIFDLDTMLKIVNLCEVSGSSESKVGRQHGSTSSTIFMMLKNKEKIQLALLCVERPMLQIEMRNAEKEGLKYALFEWFCQERSAGVPVHRSMIKAKANHFMAKY
jgi:hypothetical protein